MTHKLRHLTVFIVAAIMGISCKKGTAQHGSPLPNIILIVTDDQGYADLSAYDHASSGCHTPNMNRIAEQGVLFTQAYATAPVCSPSRVAMLTGKYQGRWDSLMYWTPGLPQEAPTLAELLKAKGYVTAKFGKSDWGRNFHDSTVREFPLHHGYDYFLGFSAHAHDFFLLDEETEKKTPDPYGWSESLGRLYRNTTKESFKGQYTTNLFTDEAISFIEQHQDAPFFIDLSYNAVHHLIHEVPPEYLAKWGVREIPKYDPSAGTYADYYWKYTQVNDISDEEMRRYYLANLNCLDDNIGRLLDVLEKNDLYDNTLIIFASDNGGEPLSGANNQPLSGSKYTMFEGGIRVPFMLSWPKQLPQGQTYHHRISTLDIVPTALEAAGVIPNESEPFDGESLLGPVIHDKPKPTASPLFFKFNNQFAVIDEKWKLVFAENYNPADRPITSQIKLNEWSGQVALFNISADPGEQENLIDQYPEVAKRLKKRYTEWLHDMAIANKHYPSMQ